MKKKVTEHPVAVKPNVVEKPEVVFDYEATWKHICVMLPTYNTSRQPVITVVGSKTVVRSGEDIGSGDNLAEAMQSALQFLREHAGRVLEVKSAEVAKLRAAMGFAPEEK